MAKILLVKTSSLGDLVHSLPAVTDIQRSAPDARIEWVVEPLFAAIPRMHPAVAGIIEVALRDWRRGFWRAPARGAIRASLGALRCEHYDAIIDMQGLIKSALIARSALGPRYGLDWHSAREPLGLFYDKTFRVPWTLHAVERNRLLVANALGYQVPPQLDYGITVPARHFDWMASGPYAVLLHATSADHKRWPENDWIAVADHFERAGIHCVVLAGTVADHERSKRIARKLRRATVAPLLSVTDIAALCAGAKIVVGVDTGLTHLAAALKTPTVGIYRATDPAATGIYGCAHAVNLGNIDRPPTAGAVIAAAEGLFV